eukprot:c11454_g1_i1.p1 GENE.c11454_g1_i1~~c11454_g1_i1.p1  ORF type:complete len:147 (+),score=33.74 c11454_g1_i1:48-488(+)
MWVALALCALAVLVVGCAYFLSSPKNRFRILYSIYRSRVGLLLHWWKFRRHPKQDDGKARAVSVYKREDVEVHAIPILVDNYAYLVVDLVTRVAAAVDPCDDQVVTAEASRLGVTITHVLTTHGHWQVSKISTKYATIGNSRSSNV